MALIFPSLTAAPPLKLEETIRLLGPHCAGFHIDIMDLHFAPDLTIGPAFVNALRQITKKPFWIHLMVDEPQVVLERLTLHKHDLISIHYENLSNRKTHHIIESYHKRDVKVGLAIKPKTPVEVIKHFDRIIDHVLLLTVEPGLSGQVLLPHTHERLQTLYDLREEHELSFAIGLDGGINVETLPSLSAEGGDIFAIGAGIFDTPDPIKTLESMKRL